MEKLRTLKVALKKWNVEVFGDVESELKEAERELHPMDLQPEVRELTEEEDGRRNEVKDLIWKLSKRKEWMWMQKLRLDWALKGDRNTRFFHIMATKKHNRNLITSALVNGVEVDEPTEVKHATCHHFQNLFTEHWWFRPSVRGDFKKIAVNQVDAILERGFSEEEVWAVVKECDGNKAPDPDGFNMMLFQKGWKFLKDDIIKFMKESIAIVDWGGKSILDGVFIANEVVDLWKTSKKKGIILKLDFQKAYNTVNWNYLLQMLDSFGFRSGWVRWMKECIESARISILVNGSPTVEFCPQRGLRQGDPLSPFLFNVVAKGLNILLSRAKDLSIIKGVVVGNSEVIVSHLQFADDTIIFCEAEWAEIMAIK
ncbi:uncharacterized protein LOC114303834 [Camellia sinensis]|uniref:uncharacterized protein LOC114303834 n=1 Tax=Camellia sinensis TaxID=4442 RepID=UPI001036510A|nr:uncharacterized protein LOC114303834 [Camellia sinensis]